MMFVATVLFLKYRSKLKIYMLRSAGICANRYKQHLHETTEWNLVHVERISELPKEATPAAKDLWVEHAKSFTLRLYIYLYIHMSVLPADAQNLKMATEAMIWAWLEEVIVSELHCCVYRLFHVTSNWHTSSNSCLRIPLISYWIIVANISKTNTRATTTSTTTCVESASVNTWRSIKVSPKYFQNSFNRFSKIKLGVVLLDRDFLVWKSIYQATE